MGLCEKCMLYDKSYDVLCQGYDDIIEGEVHHCRMYDAPIPESIYSGEGDCTYFVAREEGTDDV